MHNYKVRNLNFRDVWNKIISSDMTSGILMITAMFASIICANTNLREPIAHFWEIPLRA